MKVEMQKFMLIVPVDCGGLYAQCKFQRKAFEKCPIELLNVIVAYNRMDESVQKFPCIQAKFIISNY